MERLYANAEAEIDAEEDDTLNESEVYESELLPVLGTCRALYAFEGLFHPAFPHFRKARSAFARESIGFLSFLRLHVGFFWDSILVVALSDETLTLLNSLWCFQCYLMSLWNRPSSYCCPFFSKRLVTEIQKISHLILFFFSYFCSPKRRFYSLTRRWRVVGHWSRPGRRLDASATEFRLRGRLRPHLLYSVYTV